MDVSSPMVATDDAAEVRRNNSKSSLRWAALFLGELRDGLTMINMQSAFLIVSKQYTEKQVGILFFVFGMSQFLFQTPAGYLYDYTHQKLLWLSAASVATTILTVATALWAKEFGENLLLMVALKFVQGAVTSFIPPGLNSITQGIVGSVGMTEQVSLNEMMNHLGTAIIVLSGSLIAFFLYPDIGFLFVVSPIACLGVIFFLQRINAKDIDHAAARGLTSESHTGKESTASSSDYKPPSSNNSVGTSSKKDALTNKPSFVFGMNGATSHESKSTGLQPETPLQVLRDPTLLIFLVIVFLFHTANGTVLPLVMQTLAIGNGRSGILLSGLCIIVAQVFMVMSAKICGKYSAVYGRKMLFLIGFFSVPVRCLLLYGMLMMWEGQIQGNLFIQIVILSTQILDGIGAGTFGTMYILVTSDISGGTGRFSLILGMTTAAMSIGGTVSGYLGEALAEDLGYRTTFFILAIMSAVPALIYLTCMPETLPDLAKKQEPGSDKANIHSIKEEDEPSPETGSKARYIEMY
ncbi:MFS-type transporter [Seminavis robusta]|uniref:MFS-type transporter n=1 Tax=Seminavis robusta TaxID=568900 RepID=A0A9N8E0H5_9STRA|nr:MFS-type transporter [Seminavis robusta]|eukprot:Sro413_g138040.1 MFS-type transporter (522) ;mRNA; f:21409-23266